MARGDQIYVMRPLAGFEAIYEHHGIDCGDGTVIHYRKTDGARISRTSLASFAGGKPIYKKHQPVSFIPDIVIQRAESRLGEESYDLISNNCEHFATWCKTGKNESQQLANYGFSAAWISTPDSQRLISSIAHEDDPATALALFNQAQGSIEFARTRLRSQYQQAQTEAQSWQRVAQLALQQGKESVARAALERKVKFKQQMTDLQAQLDQLDVINGSLDRNHHVLQQRIAVTP